MNYTAAVDYLYSQLPMFQNQGARAYKPGLTTTQRFCEHLGNPQTKFKSIHVGGTNGKGSTSHMLAAILQQAGYKTGLYTSPHLKSFTERIKINGEPVSENYVVDFVVREKSYIETSSPSFFEVTVAMAFDYFANQQVDVAIIEVGMGGRLDSTNVIFPVLSVITNISFDHMQYLGDTLVKIANEKAGIIKPETPLVLSEFQSEEVTEVFRVQCESNNADFYVAANDFEVIDRIDSSSSIDVYNVKSQSLVFSNLVLGLLGEYQRSNVLGVLRSIMVLKEKGFTISDEAAKSGIADVIALTGLKGRWQLLNEKPFMVCDTAHNPAGLELTLGQFTRLFSTQKRIVIGFVGDKDIDSILGLLPKDAIYYFCQPTNQRALSSEILMAKCVAVGLSGRLFIDVNDAIEAALNDSASTDTIYVGGSTFVVADIKQL
jgi:dihydrofolate synthase/folylpolyglutamate synthase